MPHLTVELSNHLCVDELALLKTLNRVLHDSGEFRLTDIKSRIHRPKAALVGQGEGAFVAVTLAMMAGRDDTTKHALSKSLLVALSEAFADCAVCCSVEVTELSIYYQKKDTLCP